MNDFEQNPPLGSGQDDDEYPSVNREQIEAARAANNTWFFEKREMEMFGARGYIESGTDILDAKGEETGAIMIHKFAWTKETPFVTREGAFKTSLRRVGRNTKQNVKTTQSVPANAKLYADTIQGGVIRRLVNGEPVDIEKSREEMLQFAKYYPESASEAVEAWLESCSFEILDERKGDNFDWIFQNTPVKQVLWYIGNRENPLAAGIITFNSPPSEEREKFDDEVQRIDSDKKGDVTFAELSESFTRKIQYGQKFLSNVDGISVETEGNPFQTELKQKFIVLFNPIWFVEAVELMHDSFNFTKGKSAKT